MVYPTKLRLEGFGLDPFMLSYSLKGILSQRLCPKLCPTCKTETHTPTTFTLLNQPLTLTKQITAKGCKNCHFTGIVGRTVLSEFLACNPQENKGKKDNKNDKNKVNLISFFDDAKEKLEKGLVTIEATVESLAQ